MLVVLIMKNIEELLCPILLAFQISGVALNQIQKVGRTGFEPVTSCLSSMRSKPTELTTQSQGKNIKLSNNIYHFI